MNRLTVNQQLRRCVSSSLAALALAAAWLAATPAAAAELAAETPADTAVQTATEAATGAATEAANVTAADQAGPIAMFVALTRGQLAAQGFARREVEIGGRRAVWWERGEGPTLVLVHGVADQAGTWFQVAPTLAESYRVLLPDLPGHGESEPAAGPLPMSLVVEGFESWLTAHAAAEGEPPAVLVGNSMGAWIAMLAARDRPAAVSRVVAVDGGPLRPDTGGLDLLPADREAARRLMAALRDPHSPPTPDIVLDDLVRRAEDGAVRRMLAANDDLESHLLEGRLNEIVTPVDLLWGESDRYMGRDYPERLLAGLPRARLTWVPRCGHLPQAECPQKFLELLTGLLAAPPPEARVDPR